MEAVEGAGAAEVTEEAEEEENKEE